jgi:large subunit ribosomal protein L25
VLKKKNVSLLYLIDSLQIEALPDALPHSFEIDLSKLEETDQAIYVKDIPLGEDITLLSDPEQMMVKVTETRHEAEVIEAVEAAEEEEAAPEVEGEAEPATEE